MIYAPQNEGYALKFTLILEVLYLEGLEEKLWAHYHDLCVQKRSRLLRSSDTLWKLSTCKVYRKKLCVHFHDLCVKQTFLTSTFCKKLWPHFTILHAHNLCCAVRTHCDVLDFHIL